MFDKQQFVDDIKNAIQETDPQAAVSEIIERAIKTPKAIIDELGPPGSGRSEQLYEGADLTITNVVWGSEMWVPPHDHTMWAVIGVYQGQEDNTFWRDEPQGLEKRGGASLCEGDVRKLGANAIHSVRNPSATQLCGAIHVYGGDFFGAIPNRHSWNPETLERGPYDYEYINSLRAQANERMQTLLDQGVAVA